MKRLEIEWRHLDKEGRTCDRCADTGDEVRRACAEYGAVYLTAVGGAAALLGRHVTAAETVAYAELGTEALRRLELVEFPAWIAIDAQGRDLFAEARRAWSSGGALR
jgi:tartrate dehydratase beta subunit/fumarate hydratase class I family protein